MPDPMHTCATCTFQYAERLPRCLRCGAPKDPPGPYPPTGGVREPRDPKPQGPSPLQAEVDSEERVLAVL